MFVNKHCDLRSISVRAIDYMETPWNLHYQVYEDIKGRFYYDADDGSDQVILSKAETLEEALEDLKEYIAVMSKEV